MAKLGELLEVEEEYTTFRISRRDLCMIAGIVRLWLEEHSHETHFQKLAPPMQSMGRR